MIRKKLKRWGTNLVIVFNKEDEEVYNLKEGNVIDIADVFVNLGVNSDESQGSGEFGSLVSKSS